MSTKAPDVLSTPPSPLLALTLAEMHVLRWAVTTRCSHCSMHVRVSLPSLIKQHGPDHILWGQHPPCPGVECEHGKLTYTARSIRGGSPVAMNYQPTERDLDIWKKKQPVFRGPR